jgi:lipoate-protein ligase A
MRVLDAGSLDAVASQALWHGIADAMRDGEEPVLSFCRPSEPYVCVGYHRSLDELDLERCRALGLPVLRRKIGGGPVYLDPDQLFFQCILPAGAAPAGVARLYEALLAPAVDALRSLGVDAAVAGTNDIVAAGRKVSGTGAGQIGGGVVVVGNVMFAFPHERMAEVLRLPDETMRAQCLRLMRAHVGALPELDERAVKDALTRAYADGKARRAAPTPREAEAIARWTRRLSDPEWTAGPAVAATPGRQVKVRAGVWVYDAGAARVEVQDGRITDVAGPAAVAQALLGASARRDALAARLAPFGEDGARLLRTLEPGLVVR